MNKPSNIERLIDLITITAFSPVFNKEDLVRRENDFTRYLKLLQIETQTDQEGAMQLVLHSQDGKGVAA